ncbi:MAG: ATP-dependent sacrificial sulfur transferase LarE [Methanomassiliicoccaceae archaeon]|nr:ATP-dependent sacrificial sulfur transferase LarE [Methanomassiliicoccaceae archaeon]
MKDHWQLLCDRISSYNGVAVSYSGGIDSTVLLAAAVKVFPEEHMAVLADIPMLSERQKRIAADAAKELGAKLVITEITYNDIPGIEKNTKERCYLCKRSIYSSVRRIAYGYGYDTCLDGENFSDKDDERPGRKAAKEFNIVSPMKELGFHRETVEQMFSELDLSTDIQKETCLATRVGTGTPFDDVLLERIEECENIIRQISGVRQIRMRSRDNEAELFTSPDTIELLVRSENELAAALMKKGILRMSINAEGYKE